MAVAFGLVVLGSGCASNTGAAHRQDLLVAEGFKAYPAVTPGQRWLLRTLPAARVSTVVRDGKVYYVYPDPEQDVLYVGREKQYLNYMVKAQEQGYGTGGWSAEFGSWDPDEQ